RCPPRPWPWEGTWMPTTEAGAYLVIETFTSIQGEGLRIGVPSTFIRLAHCNLTCSFCDTTYAWKKGEMVPPEKLTASDVAARVNAPDVVMTGGEPLMHDLGPLLDRLAGKFVTVETNATFFKPDARVGLWSLSPKLGSSGQTPVPGVIQRSLESFPGKVQLKFVVGDRADIEAVKALLAELPAVAEGRVPVIFQPLGLPNQSRDDYSERMRALVEELLPDAWLAAYDWRFLPQLHKLLWQDKRGI
ncbi:MAG: 7-carboxy-7-deazaguanine synthase QueE, partial [Candidatus Sericytochromatia bacterium]